MLAQLLTARVRERCPHGGPPHGADVWLSTRVGVRDLSGADSSAAGETVQIILGDLSCVQVATRLVANMSSSAAAFAASLAGKKQQVSAALTARRDAVCTASRGKAGRPENYRLKVQEVCEPISGTPLAAAQRKRAQHQGDLITATQNRTELKRLEVVLKGFGGDFHEMPEDVRLEDLTFAMAIIHQMCMPVNRRKYPDPVERYAAVTSSLRTTKLPQKAVYYALYVHVKASLPEGTKAAPAKVSRKARTI